MIYLDDLLLMNRNREVLKEQTLTALDILEALGFLVNYPKSQLIPAQEVEYLGFLINSVHKELQLPRSKLDRIEAEAGQVLAKEEASARQLAQLIGRMSAAILAIYAAPLHYRSLQALKHKALAKSGYDGMVRLSQEAKEDLRWWTNNLSQWNGQMLSQSSPHCVIEMDASMMGWEAFYQGEATGGCWSPEEQKLHINELELLAVFYALRSFLKKERGITVLVRSDNIAAVSHINKLGGTRSPPLIAQTKQIFAWCLQRQIRVFAQHLPGKANLTADYLSRYLRDRTDWTLNANVFRVINQHWGPLEVDLFATRFSAQLDQFYSWRADPEAMATDAFTQHWGAIQAFSHPPWCLISRVLMKTQMEKTTVVLITPLWKAQPWFPVLLTMVIDYPILLPDVPDLLIPSPNCNCPVKDSHPCLVAWKVSGNTLLQNKFRQKLATRLILSSWRDNTNANYNSAWKKWENWCRGKHVPPFAADVSAILSFLADEFEEGKQYRSLNYYRSAISSTHLPIEGIPVGQHSLVIRLLKGAFNLRPPKPRYSQTWDVSLMLTFLRNLGRNEELSLKRLTQKLIMLLALVLGHRCSDLVRLTLTGRCYTRDGVLIPCVGLAKQARPNNEQSIHPVEIRAFKDEQLCPVSCVKAYEEATVSFRGGEERARLFLAVIAPHNPLSSSSIARWIKKSLVEAGIILLTPRDLLQQRQQLWLASPRRRS